MVPSIFVAFKEIGHSPRICIILYCRGSLEDFSPLQHSHIDLWFQRCVPSTAECHALTHRAARKDPPVDQ